MAGLAGLFGGGAPSGAMVYDPSQASSGDKLMMLGAMLKDIGSGGQTNNVIDARNMLLQRQLLGAQYGLMQQALGPDGGATGAGAAPSDGAPGASMPPTGSPPAGNAFASRQQKALAAMALLKGDAKGAWDIMHPDIMFAPDGTAISKTDPSVVGRRFANRVNVNGTIADLNDPGNTNRVIPEAPVKGAMPLYDNMGRVVDWSLPVGARAAIAGNAAATAAGQAPFDLVDVPRSDGSMVKMPRSQALALLSGGAGPQMPGGAVPGTVAPTPDSPVLGVTQSPAAAKLEGARAENQGKLESDMQGAHAAMQQVDDQTNMIRQNLHDMLGETQDPLTGQWVKTKPSMITGMSAGSGTDLIEHIPFVNQQAKDLAAKIETVRNGTSFNSLQAIKNALQAAGNGSGASVRMTDQTAKMLGEINGSLEQDQSAPQFEATVRRHLAQLDALDKARHDLFNSQYANIQTPAPGNTGPQPTAYPKRGPTVQHSAPSRDALVAEAKRRGLIH